MKNSHPTNSIPERLTRSLRQPVWKKMVSSVLLAQFALWSVQVRGATFTWDGGTDLWDNGTTLKWNGGGAWTSGNDSFALFNNASVGTLTLNAPITAGGLNFSQSGYALTGGTLTLAAPSTGGAPVIQVGMGNLLTNSGLRATIGSVVAGSDGLAKTGNGTLLLTNSGNTYTGATVVRGGILTITDQDQLGASTGTVGVSGISALGFQSGSLLLQGGAASGPGFSGSEAFTRDLSLAGRGNSSIGNGALVSIGNNTVTGDLLSSGITETRISSAGGMLTIDGRVNPSSGNSLYIYGPGNFTISGQVVGGLGGASNIIKGNTGFGSSTLILTNNNNSMAGGVRAEGGFVRVSHGAQLGLINSTAESNDGNLNFNGGTFEIRSDNPASFATRNISYEFGSGTVFVDRAIGTLGASTLNQTFTFANLRQENSRTFTFSGRNGNSVTLAAVNNSSSGNANDGLTNSGNGLVTWTGNIWGETDGTARTLTITATGEINLTGSILAPSAVQHTFTKAGSGTMTLGGTASSFVGSATLSAGTLNISGIGALNSSGTGRVVFSGGTLNYTGAGETWNKVLLLNATNNILTNNGSGGIVVAQNVGNNSTGTKNLVLGGSNGGEVQGIIVNTTAGAGVTKFDSGTWTITSPGTGAANIGTANGAFAITAVGGTASQTITTTNTAGLVVGQPISGTGIPFGTVISQIISGTQFAVSQGVSNTGTSVVLGTVTGATAAVSVTANTGNTLTVGSTANLVPGQPITGPGMPAGAGWYIASIASGTTFTVANTTGAAALANSAAIGSQTPSLSPNYAGPLTISGGQVNWNPLSDTAEVVSNGAGVTFAADPIRGNYAGGTLNYNAFSTGSSETAGVLAITAGVGTVKITPTAGTNNLTFGSLTAPSAGTSLNFEVPAGPGTNSVTLLTAPSGFVNAHAYYNGADFAYSPTTTNSVLRAPVYGTDAGFVTSGTALTASSHNEITGSFSSGALSINSLRIAGSQTLTLTGNLTLGTAAGSGILQVGGSGVIGGTGSIVASAAGNDVVVRVEGSGSSLEIARPIITSTAGLTKNGAGTLTLSGANTFTGTTTINDGTLRMATGGTLGGANINLTMRQGTTFDMNGVSLGTVASATNSISSLTGLGTITNSAASGTATLRVGGTAGSGVFIGTIQDGATAKIALVKAGTGTQRLTGTNTFTGPVTVLDGIIAVNSLPNIGVAGPIGPGIAGISGSVSDSDNAASLVFAAGTASTLRYTGADGTIFQQTQTPSIATNRLFTVAGGATGGIESSGTYGNNTLAAGAANNATLIFNSSGEIAYTGTGTATIRLGGTSTGDNEFNPRLNNANFALTKDGVGLWIVNPTGGNNSYNGATQIREGSLRAVEGVGLPATSNLNLNGTSATVGGVYEGSGSFTRALGTAGGQVQWTAATAGGFAASTAPFAVNIGGAGATLTWNSTAGFLTTGSLLLNSTTALDVVNFTNPIDLNAGTRVVTVADNTTTGTDYAILSGVISGTGASALTKNGTGLLYITGANTYNGNTTIQDGIVGVTSIGSGGASSNFGNATGSLTLGNTGTATTYLLYTGGGENATRAVSWNSTTGGTTLDSSGSGPLVLSNFSNTGNGAKTLTLRGMNTDANTISSIISNGSGGVTSVTKNDGGTWVLTGANTYTGTTSVQGGWLGIGGTTGGTANNPLPGPLALGGNFVTQGIFATNPAGLTISSAITLTRDGSGGNIMIGGTNPMTWNGTLAYNTGGDMTITNVMSGSTFTINSSLINPETSTTTATPRTFNVRGTGNWQWNGAINNNVLAVTHTQLLNISIDNAANFTIGGTPSFAAASTGSVTLSQGNLILERTTANFFGGADTQTFAFNGGTLAATNDVVIPNPITLGGNPAIFQGTNSINLSNATALSLAASRSLINNIASPDSLTISGGISNTATATLSIFGSGNTLISGVYAAGTGTNALQMLGTGTLTLTSNNAYTGTSTFSGGTTILSGNGRLGDGAIAVNQGATLTLDNSGGNPGAADRLDNRALTLSGANFNFIGNASGSDEGTGGNSLAIGSGQTIFNITDNGGGTFATQMDFTTLAINAGGSVNFTSNTTLGTTTNRILFSTAPTLVPATTGILARATINSSDFATYGANGITAFTNYNNGGAYTDINSAGATDTLKVGSGFITTDDITASRTVNALNIEDSTARTISATGNNTLTLTSGGLLVEGGGGVVHTLSVPRVALGAEGGFNIASGTTLNITGTLTGTAGVTKALPGTLTLTGQQFYTGATTVNNGTLNLGFGTNTLFPGQALAVNQTGVVNLNNNIQQTGSLSGGTNPGSGGTINLGTALLVVNQGGNTTWSGNIAGNGNFARVGGSTLTLNSANGYSGATTLMGGVLTLRDNATLLNISSIDINYASLLIRNNDNMQVDVANRIANGASINLRGGLVDFGGRALNASSEVFGALTSAQGANRITASAGGGGSFNSATITFASLTRSNGSTMDFAGTNLGQAGNQGYIQFTSAPTTVGNLLLGSWAIANSTDYAAYNNTMGVGAVGTGGFTGYDWQDINTANVAPVSGVFASGNVTNLNATAASSVLLGSGGAVTGLLRFGGGFTNDLNFANANDTLNLTLGGILRSNNNNATTIGTTTTRGIITSGIGELVVYNAQNTLTINSSIQGATQLIKSGAGTLTLTAANTYSLGTVINQGTVNISPTVTDGSVVVIPAGGLTINGGIQGTGVAVNSTAAPGAIAASTDLTINGRATLTYGNAHTNTLNSITLNNNGGEAAPTVAIGTGSTLILSSSTPITATSGNAATTSTISGGTLALGSGSKTFNIAPIAVGSQTYNAIAPTLNISAAITGTGPITKSGTGLLQLGGANTFTGLNVTTGGIVVGASSTHAGGPVTSGPLGLGQVAMSSGTSLFTAGSFALGNDVSFAGTPTFNSTANTVWTLSLLGNLTGAGLTGGTPTIEVTNPGLTVALLGNLPAASSYTKTGLGTLIFNATNYTGDFNASALGNPNAISLIHDGDRTGSVQTISMGNVIFDSGVIPNITVNRGGSLPFAQAANKILAPTSITNLGLGLTVNVNAGYGLKASDAIAFTGTPTFTVTGTQASNVIQGLYLSGDLTGTGFNKAGTGTLVIDNTTPADNTFTGNINITQGVVSVSSDALLGNSANQIRLNPSAGSSTFRATDSFATSRVIDLSTASNTRAIEVVSGKTLTLNSGFGLTAAAAGLLKADLGTLELAAANTGWSGNLTINAGAVSTSLASALGTGTLIVNEASAALQLNGGITVTNPITIDVLANGRVVTGFNTGGALQGVTGSNIISGTITANASPNADNQTRSFGLGANSGASLTFGNLNFDHDSGTGQNVIIYLGGAGDLTLNGVINNTNGAPGSSFIFKHGSGNMTITSADAIPDTEVRIYRGGMTLSGAGTFGTSGSQVQVWQNGSLTLDNSVTNTPNRFGSNRVANLGGGLLNVIPNASGSSHVSSGTLNISQGSSTINLGSGGNLTVTFGSLTQNAGSTLNLTGTFGTANNKLNFTTAPTLSPAVNGLLARVLTNGNEFATYSPTTGIGTFNGYALVSNILSAGATQTFNATDTTANSLTGNQTLNALKLSSGAGSTNVGGLSGLNPTTLTLTSGGILAGGTGTTSTLSVPVVSFGATGTAEAIIHVLSGQTLNVTSGLVTTGGLTKSSNGVMNFNAQQFVSGNTIVNAGTLNLQSGAVNTLLFNNGLGINTGATVDLKNGAQYVGGFFSANGGGNTDLGGGILTNSGAEATFVTNTNAASTNFNGQINGTIYLNKTGANTLALQGATSYTGKTFISNGTLTIQDDATILNTSGIDIHYGTLTINNAALRDNANRVGDTTPITLRGGTLNFAGRFQANSSETVGAVTITEGNNSIFANDADIGIGSGVLTIASLNRTGATSTLRFNNVGDFGLIGTRGRVMITANPTLTNNILGPWAVIDREFASYDPTYGVGSLAQVGFAGYSAAGINGGATGTDHVRHVLAGTTTLLANTTVGTLNFASQATATTLDLDGKTLTIQGGGLIFGQGTDNIAFAVNNGNLTGPAGGGDLFIHHLNYSGTGRTVSIGAAITDNGGPVRLIKNSGDTGASVMTLNGTNTYTGGTVINMGTLTLGATSTLGTGGITIYQGALTQTAGATIPAQQLTMSGPGTVTLAGNNTLTGITFNNMGGGTPTINPTGTLTLTGGITTTSVNAGSISTISNGTLNLNGAGSYSMNVGAALVNGINIAPWQAGLIINSVIDNGGISKSGAGLLQLGGQSTFTGGINVTNGGLVIGASSTPSTLGDPVVTGPLGTGTVTMAAGTTLVSTAANAVSNDFVFLGDTVFNGVQNLTLNGNTTLPATWNATVTAPQMTVTIGNVINSLTSDVINKSGLGLLVVGSYNGTIQATGGLVFTGDGNTLGTRENVALGGNLTITGDTAITINRSGAAPNARNKVLQKANLSVPGNIMSVSNQSGYGLEFTGTTTMTGPSHFAVGVATASNVVQGLILSGPVVDGALDFGIIKSGLGTLELNGVNTFGGAGQTIDILNGIVSVNSDSGLGNALNTVTLNVDASTGVGFRSTGTFSTARTFILNQANNAFEVTQGNELTLTSPFSLSAVTNTLTKNDSGIFTIGADNTGWTGGITINGGIVRLANANAAGSGTINVSPNAAVTGSALQLSGSISVSNPINLQGTGNLAFGGVNFGGQLESFSGSNTVTGQVGITFDAAIGAATGATLNINGGIHNSTTTGRALVFTGGGTINLNSNITSATTTANQYFSMRKYGAGTLNVTTALSIIPTDAGGLQVWGGTLALNGSGTLAGGNTIALQVQPGGTVTLDNAVTNTPNRLGGRPVTLTGGTFNYVSNAGTSTEGLGALTVARPGSTIFANSNGGTSTLTFANLASNVVNADASLNFVSAGAALGSASNRILITTSPTLTGNIIQRATVNSDDFATWTAGNGIAAFAAYQNSNNPNTAAAADTMNLTASADLTANRTLNAIKFNSGTGVTLGSTGAAFVAGGLTPAQLVLTAGGIIATGATTHTISVPVLNNAAVQNFYSVSSGSSLNITSAIVGTAGWVKTGAGTLTFSPPSSPIAGRGASTISGNATINEGTLVLNGGNNTLAANNFLIMGPGGTLNLNGNAQLARLMTDAAVENGGGIVTGNAASVMAATYTDDRNWAGSLQGGLSFLRTGSNTLTMYSDNTYTGKTLIGGGAVTLRDGARLSGTTEIELAYATLNIDNNIGFKDMANRVNDAAPITLRGGTLAFTGRAQTASTETVGAVTLAHGNSFINSTTGGTNVNSADLTLASLNRAVGGGTVNFTASGQIGSNARILIPTINGVSTATVGGGLTNEIIGGWAIIGTSDFATYIPGLGVVAMGGNGALQYSNVTSSPGTLNAAGATDNISINTAVTGNTLPVTNDLTINSLRIGNIAAQTINIAAGKTLTLSSGGLLFFSTASQTIGAAANQGSLTTTGPELFIYTQGTGPQIINSSITGAGVMLVKSGANGLTLNGTNTYTGGTTINQGTIALGPLSNIPLATNPLNGLILSGSTFTASAAGQIASGNIATLNGPSTLSLVGNNTLAGLIFRNDGSGTTVPTVNSNSGTLTLNGNLVSTSANPAVSALLSGRVDFGTTQRTLDISASRFNGQELAALLPDFTLQGITGSSGGIIKAGDGVLQFNGAAIYTGATTVNNGRLQIGATNGGSRFSAYNLTTSTTGINLNGFSTILGSLEGSGFVTNSSASTTAQTLTVGFNGNSTTFSGSFLRFNDATPGTVNLTKVGNGALSLTSNANTNLGVLTVNRGAVVYKDAGVRSFLGGPTVVNKGGALTLDNSNANSSGNVNNRLGNAGLTLNGGTFNLLGRDSTATSEVSTGALTFGAGSSTFNLTSGTSGTAFATFGSLSQSAGAIAAINGTNLGTDTRLLFTTAPTLVPASTGILSRVAVGTDFATYNGTNGVVAFTGYTTPTDINAAAATATIKVEGTTTGRNINLARTINALNVIDNDVTIASNGALLPTQGWTVTSGGVLVNGNNAALNTGVLAFGATEGIFRINGSALNVTSSITGSAGINKAGSGSMTLSSPQSYTGQTTVNLGNLTLAGGTNTLLVAPTGTIPTVSDLMVNEGVFNLNGNNQAVRTLLSSNVLAPNSGEITNSSLTTATLTAAMNASATFGAAITGNINFVRSGNNTLTLPDASTYTGSTVIRGGGLTLQDQGSLTTSSITLNFGALTLNNANLNPLAALNPVRFAASTPVTMQGGSLVVTPGGSVDNTTTINSVTILAGGANTITPNGVTGGTNTITIGNLVIPANTGTTLHYSTDPGQPTSGGAQVFLTQINSATPTNNAFLGSNVIINSGEYGVYNTVQGVIRFGGTAVTGNTVPAYAAALTSGLNSTTAVSSTGADVAISANTTVGALRLTGAATRAITFATGNEVLNLALGGLLRDNNNNATNIGTTALRGVLTSGGIATTGTTELVEWHNQNTVTINSVIANNGLGNLTRFVKAGPAATTLTAANTYTGGTVVNAGTLTINATAGAGTVVIPAGGVTLNNATLTMSTNQGQIDASNTVMINGSGVLNMAGTNTLNSLVFNNSGGNATPTVATATQLTLSSATPINSVNDNFSFTPTISGTLLTLQDGAAISTSGASPVNLIISAPISTAAATAPLAKNGTGSLVLSSAASTFANGFNLNQGTLIFATSSAGTPPALTAGPIGTGTLTLANDVAIMSEGTARTIGNAVSVVQDFTFGTRSTDSSRAAAGNSLTLSGVVTLAPGAHTINVGGLLMVGTISGQLTGGTDLNVSGPGTLVLSNNTNNYGGNTTVMSGGVLRTGSATPIPTSSLLTINSGGFLDAVNNPFITLITGSGTVSNSAASTLSIGGTSITDLTNPANNTFAGVIGNGVASLGLQKVGAGSLTLTGANVYSGTTTVVSGSLVIGATNTLPVGGTVVVGTAATTGTTTATLDLTNFDQTVGALTASTTAATASSNITIGNGRTLTVTGAVTVGATGGTSTTNLNVTGASGTFSIGTLATPTNANVQLGNATTDGTSNGATLDMSGLGTFYANLGTGTFRIGDPTNGAGTATLGSTLILAADSTITAAILRADSPDSGVTEAIKLGSGTNRFNVTTLNIGAQNGRSNGTLSFNTSTGTLTIRGLAGGALVPDNTSRATLNVVNNSFSTGANPTASFDTTGHAADLLFGTMTIAGRTANTGGAVGSFSFDNGTLDANELIVGTKASGSTATTNIIAGTVTLNGGTSTFNNTTSAIALGVNASTAVGTASGTFNVGGTAIVTAAANGGNSFVLGHSTAAGGTAAGIINLTGGSLTVAGHIVRGTATGTSTATLNLNGGLLDMGGQRIGGTVAAQNLTSLTFAAGTLQNVAEINNGAALTKTTAGTLIMQGVNTYTGGTAIDGGTLQVNSAGAIGSSGTVSFGGGTLQYTTNNTTDYSSRFSTAASQAVSIDTNSQAVTFATALTSTGGSLTKSGAGTLTTTAVNTYTGTTTVNGGVLQVGTTATAGTAALSGAGAVTVNAGATLTGTGTIAGAVTVQGAGTNIAVLTPGDNSGATNARLNLGNSLSIGANGQLQFQVTTATYNEAGNLGGYLNALAFITDGANSSQIGLWNAVPTLGNSDFIDVAGGLTINTSANPGTIGTVRIIDNGYVPQYGDVFNLIDWVGAMGGGFNAGSGFTSGGILGDFDLPMLSGGFAWDTSAFVQYGVVVVVPEPGRALLMLLGLMALFFRRRRRD